MLLKLSKKPSLRNLELMSNNLQRLHSEGGQSPWLDNLKRSYITSGHMRQVIDSGIRGLTSNPSIFQRAIQGSTDYDEQFADLAKAGKNAVESYWEMVVKDIRDALDLFHPVYLSSDRRDGYVSVEVDPMLAHDAEGTTQAARTLDKIVERPNVMIKIPATVEGIPVIREMISEGRNVNITLIFSLERYSDVIEAYISGMESLAQSNPSKLSHVASVASFFISRVDVEVDKRLAALGTPDADRLLGLCAIAQAKLAYKLFTDRFTSDRWQALANLGAREQRPLWASTSTKNPLYPDTLYVDQLIGPLTVNTLPDPTMEAFSDHGTIKRTIDTDIEAAEAAWAQLRKLGVDMSDVADQLEREGVDSFQKSFQELITALEEKLETF